MLSMKQKVVARVLFEGRLTDGEVCREYNISSGVLAKWRQSDEFAAELDRLCLAAAQAVRCMLARSAPAAAAKLVALLEAEKGDTARRAALELIDRCVGADAMNAKRRDDDEKNEEAMTEEEARKMLVALAQGVNRSFINHEGHERHEGKTKG